MPNPSIDPVRLLSLLFRHYSPSERKLRLLAVAFFRLVIRYDGHPALDSAERYADGELPANDLRAASADDSGLLILCLPQWNGQETALAAAGFVINCGECHVPGESERMVAMNALICEVLGLPIGFPDLDFPALSLHGIFPQNAFSASK